MITMSTIRRTQLLLSVIFLITIFWAAGCSDDDGQSNVLAPDTASAWWEHQAFRYSNKILLTAHATDDMLLVSGLRAFNTLTPSGQAVHYGFFHGARDLNCFVRPSDRFYAIPQTYGIRIGASANVAEYNTELRITATDLIPNFEYWNGTRGLTGYFNEADQLLLAYDYTTETRSHAKGLWLLDLNTNVGDIGITAVELTGSRFMPFPGADPNSVLRALVPLDDGFLFSTEDGIWRLSNNGEIRAVHDQLVDYLFVDGDLIYGIGLQNRLLRSSDGGTTWQNHGYISNNLLRLVKIGDRTIGYLLDKIWEVDLENLEISEIVAEILDGNEITSIVEFNGDICVTTLSGMFVCPIDSFFTAATNPNKSGGLKIGREMADVH